MQRKGENRVREYLSKRKRYKRWISIVIVLAILVGLTTIYSLNQDASATTQDGAGDVGMVLEDESGSQENASEGVNGEAGVASSNSTEGSVQETVSDSTEDGSETDNNDENIDEADNDASSEASDDETNEEDASSIASTLASSTEATEQKSDYVAVNITVSVVDEDGSAISQDYSDLSIDSFSFDSNGEISIDSSLFGGITSNNSDGNTVYYEYSKNSLNGEAVTSIKREKAVIDSSAVDSTSDSSTEEYYAYYYTKDNNNWIKITSDTQIILTYASKGISVDLTMSVVDEFGEEIDSSLSNMELPEFTDNVLVLDDVDNAPVAKVRKVIKTYSTYKKYSSEYQYVHATIDGNVVKNVKRSSIDSKGSAYAYSYTTDGENYTDITSDTVIVLEYASDDSDTYKFTYDDENVVVTAVLQNANAIPENAVLKATRITDGEAFDSYIEALNAAEEDKEAESQVTHTEDNTLLYDIAFIVTEKDDDGNSIEVEYEPTEGSVKITIEFKDKQLSEIGVSSVEDIDISHMILSDEIKESAATTLEASKTANANDIVVEEITAESVEAGQQNGSNEKVEFVAESFSVYAITVSQYGTYITAESATDYDYETSLGDAYDYGVVTNTYTWSGDTESNVMAGYVESTGKDMGTSANYSNAGGNNYFGDFDTSVTTISFHQTPANIYLGSGASSKYNNGALTFVNADATNVVTYSSINVRSIIDSIDDYYDKYEGLGNSFEAAYRDYGGTTIDLTSLPDGTYVVTYTGDNIHIDDEKLIININEGQHLILNCTSSSLSIGTYVLNGYTSSDYVGSTDSSNDWITTAVIFNIVNAENVTISNTCGTFIAPDSNVSTGAVNAGVVVANSISSGNEWHYHNHELPSVEDAEVVLKAKKTVNGNTPSETEVFTFQLYEAGYNNNTGTFSGKYTFIEQVENKGTSIKFSSISYNKASDVGDHYYIISEVVGTGSYNYDESIYVAKVTVSRTKVNNVWIYSASEPVYYLLEESDSSSQCYSYTPITTEVPVFNNILGGYLRIHKMVVNDFGSDFVRDKTKTALLKQVTFRITNTSDKSYIVFTGFVSGQSDVTYESDGRTIKDRAVEYDRYGNLTGNTYDVTYNNNAQWTISNIPTGTYVVDEVADGLTLGYNAVGNYYYAITDSGLSRVTKYAVTTDSNDGLNNYGTGGENYRAVFSVDVSGGNPDNLSNNGQEVTVSNNYSDTQTVQVCNYYSTPMAPLEITKSFTGGTWEEDMVFSFKLEGVSATDTVLSDGTAVQGVAVPMPDASSVTGDGVSAVLNEDNTYTLSLNSSAATLNEDGSYTANASFGNISYVYEGTYTYKITEVQTGADGVIYDTNVYYATVVVSKQYTTFSKTYSTWVNYKDGQSIGAIQSNGQDSYEITKTEDFFYLGADVTYTSETGEIVAKCSVRLNSGLNTANPVSNPYVISYESSYNSNGVEFVNGYAAIKVVKSAGIEGTIDNGTEFSFRVYDANGKALKVYGYSVDANGNTTWYSSTKDRNIVQVGGYVVITGYKSGTDSSGNEIISNLVSGATYKIVELNSNSGNKVDGAPEGYSVSYYVTAAGSETTVEGNSVELSSGVTTVNIVNYRTAKLTVNKEWLDSSGLDDSANHTYLDLYLYRKTANDTQWEYVDYIQLTDANGWTYIFENLAPFDANGNVYEYVIAESDSYYSLYSVTYSYVDANGNTTTAQGAPDYIIALTGNTYDYGQVTITNMSLVNNVLPSTGGIGTTVFRVIGGLFILAAIVFFIMKRSKKKS